MLILERFSLVRFFVFETDHVLTDGRICFPTASPTAARSFFARDLYAIRKAVQQGYSVSVISPPPPESMAALNDQWGVSLLHPGDRMRALTAGTTLYMNSMYPTDLTVAPQILYCCPSDAVAEIKSHSDYISPLPGGSGCVYDVIQKVLALNGHW